MTLKQYISLLEKRDPNKKVPIGLGNPHPWRGNYGELAFEPIEDITIGEMLIYAISAVNTTYQKHKGGEIKMTLDTAINVDYVDSYSDNTTLFSLLFSYMLS